MTTDGWKDEAKRYAGNADYWRDRAEAAEAERDALRKDAERLNYWAENAAGEFLFDATNHEFIEFLPKKPPRSVELVKAAIDAAIAGKVKP